MLASRDHRRKRQRFQDLLDIPELGVVLLVHLSPSSLFCLTSTSKSIRKTILENRFAIYRCYVSYYGSYPLALTRTLEHRYLAVDIHLVQLFLARIRYLHLPIRDIVASGSTCPYPKEVRDAITSKLEPAVLDLETGFSRFPERLLDRSLFEYCDSPIWLLCQGSLSPSYRGKYQVHDAIGFIVERVDPGNYMDILQRDKIFGSPYFNDHLRRIRCRDILRRVHQTRPSKKVAAFMKFVHQLRDYLPLMNPFSEMAYLVYACVRTRDSVWAFVKTLIRTQAQLEKLVLVLFIEHPEYLQSERWSSGDFTLHESILTSKLVDFLGFLVAETCNQPELRVDLAVESTLLSKGFLDSFLNSDKPQFPTDFWGSIWLMKDTIDWLEPMFQKLFQSLVTGIVDSRIDRYRPLILEVFLATKFHWYKELLSACPDVHRQLILQCWPAVFTPVKFPFVDDDDCPFIQSARYPAYRRAYRHLVAAYEEDAWALLQEIKSSPLFKALSDAHVKDFHQDFGRYDPLGLGTLVSTTNISFGFKYHKV